MFILPFLKRVIFALPLIGTACAAQVPVPPIPIVDDRSVLSLAEDDAIERLISSIRRITTKAPQPPTKASLPQTGETTSYGVVVNPSFANALQKQFSGENASSIDALRAERSKNTANINFAFESWFLEAQNLMALGRFDDAEAAIAQAETYERRLFKTNVNSRSLLGEIKFWASDYDAAANILSKVAVATRAWKLPTSYGGPPTNLPELFDLTTAQLRAYTTLAAIYLSQNDFESALPWATRAERGYADVFFVAHHPLYGPFVPTHADSYYGRALNLAVLGGATLVVEKDRKAAEGYFAAAHGFLDAVNFDAPKLTVNAIKAQSLLNAGSAEEAAELATQLTTLATRQGRADLVWRIELLKGEALLQTGATAEAEKSFRTAQSAVNVVVGRLSTDRSKRRFGIGKDALTYHLANADIAKGDLAGLFVDLERGRARAFVDMLAAQKVSTGRGKKLADEIKSTDSKIRAYRLKSAAPLNSSEAENTDTRMLLERRNLLIEKLRKINPEHADIYAISTTTLASTQERLNPNELLLYTIPSRAGEPIRWLEITAQELKITVLDLQNRDLRKKLGEFRDAAKRGSTSNSEQKRILSSISKSLKVENWSSRDAIYIVPSGQLYFVPWGALTVSAPVAVLPNGGWIARTANPSNLSAAVVVGDPDFHGTLPQLEGARTEAVRVGKHYGTTPLIGSSATNQSMRREVGDGARILHIATHADFDARAPLKSALYLSGEKGADALTAGSIFENPLPADLVILSACETGVGKAIAGDDFLGLARSFYLGGARTVINSLWPVDDAGTLAFMTAFHQNLSNGDIGQAWMRARDAVKRAGYPPSVYGAFAIGGALKM